MREVGSDSSRFEIFPSCNQEPPSHCSLGSVPFSCPVVCWALCCRHPHSCALNPNGFLLGAQVPLLPLPPRLAGQEMKQQDGIRITQKAVDIYDTMLGQMNKAIQTLPVLKRPAR